MSLKTDIENVFKIQKLSIEKAKKLKEKYLDKETNDEVNKTNVDK